MWGKRIVVKQHSFALVKRVRSVWGAVDGGYSSGGSTIGVEDGAEPRHRLTGIPVTNPAR